MYCVRRHSPSLTTSMPAFQVSSDGEQPTVKVGSYYGPKPRRQLPTESRQSEPAPPPEGTNPS